MKEEKTFVAAIDVGSSKIVAVIAEVSRTGSFSVVAQGRAESRGVEGGRIKDVDALVLQIKEAISDLSRFYKSEIPNVYATISGPFVVGKDSSAQKPVRGDQITDADIKHAKQMAQEALGLSSEQRPIKSEVYSYFYNDGAEDYSSPIEHHRATRVTVHMHTAVTDVTNANLLVKSIRRSSLDVRQPLPQGWASGYAVLSEDERNNGVVVVDIGAESTDVVVFFEGKPRYTKTLPYGAKRVTERLAGYMHCTMRDAEDIKPRLNLRCLPEHDLEFVTITNHDGVEKKFSLLELSEIAAHVMGDMVGDICKGLLDEGWIQLREAGGMTVPFNTLPSGFVVTGGGSLMMGIEEIFEAVPEPCRFTFATRQGRSRYDGEACIGLNSPKESAVMGLISYAAIHFRDGDDDTQQIKAKADTPKAKFWRFLKTIFTGEY